jgi:hypothetical protein
MCAPHRKSNRFGRSDTTFLKSRNRVANRQGDEAIAPRFGAAVDKPELLGTGTR